jgi:hypothetical protein
MRYFLTRAHPPTQRVLLVESGPRHVLERLLPALERNYGRLEQIDLLTCHAGAPQGFDPERGRIYHVQDHRGWRARQRLFKELRSRQPDICGLLCTGLPIMTPWKWLAAWHAPSKIFLINENGDYFWLDRGHGRIIWRFMLIRAGLSGGDALPHLGELLVLPFTFTYLLLYAAQVHSRRWLRAQ